MKKAVVAKKSGQTAPSTPSKADRESIFRCSSQPRASSRALRLTRGTRGARDDFATDCCKAVSRVESRRRRVAHERHVGVLERGLAGRDAAHLGPVEAAEHRVGQLSAGLGLDDDEL